MTFDTLTRAVIPCPEFTGVPRLVRAFVDDRQLHVCLVQELVSQRPLLHIVRHFMHKDLSQLVYAWLVQSLFVLATLESKEVMHRDIKPDHLRISRDGSLALIDWGLATSHADNKFLT
jgi:serine/threonine protein kinase